MPREKDTLPQTPASVEKQRRSGRSLKLVIFVCVVFGVFLFAIIFFMKPEAERPQIVGQRVKAGIARSIEAGSHYGKVPYGFTRVNGKLIPEPKEQRIIERIRDLGGNGNGHKAMTRRELVKVLDREGYRFRSNGIFSLALIHRVLTDPMYRGV